MHPEKLKKSQPKETSEDILNKFGNKPAKPRGKKPTGNWLTQPDLKQTLWIGNRGSSDIVVRSLYITLDAKNKINRIAEILDALNERTSNGGYKYKKDIFESVDEFENAMSNFLKEASAIQINNVMGSLSWSGMNTEAGYNGNVKDFADVLSRLSSQYFNVDLKQSALGIDSFNQ